MAQKRTTAREIVTQYLTRIATYEDRLNAAITVNPRALAEADERDRERARASGCGPLHGIPIALKDNIHTTDLPTTGGALAFDGLLPPYPATHHQEPARGRGHRHRQDPDDRAGQLGRQRHAHELQRAHRLRHEPLRPAPGSPPGDLDGRPALATGGSSSGAGTAASFWAANVGTETSGSILSPSNQNLLVGIKPTVGRISRHGIIPITADQDTAGPDGAHGDRRRHPAGRAGGRGARSRRPRHARLPAAGGRRLHALSRRPRPGGRPHRRPAGLLLRQAQPARRQGAARRPRSRAHAGSWPR